MKMEKIYIYFTLPEARLTKICCLIALQKKKTSLGYNYNV